MKIKSICFSLALGLLLSQVSHADESLWYRQGDPFNTMLDMPPAIGTIEGGDTAAACAAANYQNVLSLADVAEAALCNNPQTRESYANAKVQAALIGVAKSA